MEPSEPASTPPGESVAGHVPDRSPPLAEPAVPAPSRDGDDGGNGGGGSVDGHHPEPPVPPRITPSLGALGVYHVVPGGMGGGNGSHSGARRGATAAEALATELHREIALREQAERRATDSETRLAEVERQLAEARSAPPPPRRLSCHPHPGWDGSA